MRGELPTVALESAFVIEHVISPGWHRIDAPRELHLEHHLAHLTECDFCAGEIELPLATERFPEIASGLFPVRRETRPPVPQRLGVVEPQDLEIGAPELGVFDGAHYLG